jgi:hypothetical protein
MDANVEAESPLRGIHLPSQRSPEACPCRGPATGRCKPGRSAPDSRPSLASVPTWARLVHFVRHSDARRYAGPNDPQPMPIRQAGLSGVLCAGAVPLTQTPRFRAFPPSA